jgi:phosphohistidine phosphatase
MNLYLLRHGLAVERTPPGFKLDSDRPLTPEGRKKIRRLALILSQLPLSFGVILTSPFVRARQTAETIAEILEVSNKLEICKHLAPKQPLTGLVEELNRRKHPSEDILLAGHEPDLSRLISILVTGKPGLALELKKGGLCKLEIGTLRYGRCATLQWLLAPKLYSALR